MERKLTKNRFMNRSEILFALRNHFHKFNEFELKNVFENTVEIQHEQGKFNSKHDKIIMTNDRILILYYKYSDYEWTVKIKNDRAVLHNEFGNATSFSRSSFYCVMGKSAKWCSKQRKFVIKHE